MDEKEILELEELGVSFKKVSPNVSRLLMKAAVELRSVETLRTEIQRLKRKQRRKNYATSGIRKSFGTLSF